jgi:hypothetical protein
MQRESERSPSDVHREPHSFMHIRQAGRGCENRNIAGRKPADLVRKRLKMEVYG